MNILIFNWRDIKNEWAGGGEVYVFELAKRWVEMGHVVNLFCGQDIRKNLPEEENIDGINVFRKGGRYSLYLWAFVYYFKKFRKNTDVIVDVQNGIPFFTPLFSFKKKISIVHHVHGAQFFYELPKPIAFFGFVIEKYMFSLIYRSQTIIAVSSTTKKELQEIGFKSNNIKIVHNGVLIPKNFHKIQKFHRPTIIYLGRIKKYKRINLLIKLMPEILKKVPDARLLIAGWGTEGGFITDEVMRGNVRKHVDIVGPVSETDKRKLLSQSWVFVNPSIGEGWGISVIEANIHRTPSVAFKVKGLSESIKNGVTGYLAINEEDFVNKICLILTNSDLRKTMSEDSLSWAKMFTWEKAAKDSLKIIQDVNKNG